MIPKPLTFACFTEIFLWKNEAITCWLISVPGQGNVNIDKNQNGKKKVDKLDLLDILGKLDIVHN